MAGFDLIPRVRKRLLDHGGRPLLDLHHFVYRTDDEALRALSDVASTEREARSLSGGYVQLLSAIHEADRVGRAPSNTLAWIIPARHVTKSMRIRTGVRRHIESTEFHSQLGSDYAQWLPWMSLGVVNLLRMWRQPRISALRRVLLKMVAGWRAGERDGAGPWEKRFDATARRVPIQALYQFEPTSVVDDTITTLRRLGLGSVNDLRCFHPQAVECAKAEGDPLLALYRIVGDFP